MKYIVRILLSYLTQMMSMNAFVRVGIEPSNIDSICFWRKSLLN